MTSNEFIAAEINRIWMERAMKWRNRLLQIYSATMTEYNARQVRMVVDEIDQINQTEQP